MTFRPYPGLTIASALLFVPLCGLGTWQLERLQWKLALIARVDSHMAAAPLSLDQIQAMNAEEAQYRRVTLKGRFDHTHEAYVFTTDAGAPVYHVLTPFIAQGGQVLMVDRGEVPKEKLDPVKRSPGNLAGQTHVTGVWRVPDAPGLFTPPPDTAHRASQLCGDLVRTGRDAARCLARLQYFQGPDRLEIAPAKGGLGRAGAL
jgi:surfeit locus 1 family protein